jgi:general secretion pathway protein A
MYEDFFGFRERPFKLQPDPEYLFLSRQHRLALVHLEYGFLNRAGFVVVTGEIGTGKTTLIKALLRRLDQKIVVASVFNTMVETDEFLALILQEFEQPRTGQGRAEKIEQLNAFLISCYAQGERAVLMVDEAQNLSLEILEEIRLLSNLQTDKDYLLQIVLVGQPELRNTLSHPGLRQLAQRISVHYHLSALSEEETSAYIRHRLEVARGGEGEEIFPAEALQAVYRHTQGIPRLINLLCDACLVHCFADEVRRVTAPMVDEVVEGEDSSYFWSMGTSATCCHEPDLPGMGVLGQGPDETGLEALKDQVRELQNSLLVLNRLVHERLLAQEPAPQETGVRNDSRLIRFLDEEREKVKRLASERARLLKEIEELSADRPPTGGGGTKKKGRLWPSGPLLWKKAT